MHVKGNFMHLGWATLGNIQIHKAANLLETLPTPLSFFLRFRFPGFLDILLTAVRQHTFTYFTSVSVK